MRHLWHLPIRNLLTRKARSLLTTLGVVLGVAMVVAIAVAYDSAETFIKQRIQYWHGGAQLRVRPCFAETLPAGFVEKTAQVPGVRLATPQYNRWVYAQYGERYYALLLTAINPGADSELGGFVAGFETDISEAESQGLRPILLHDPLARKLKATVGGDIMVMFDGKHLKFRLVGILAKTSFATATPWNCGVTTLAGAQEILGESPEPAAIDVLLSDKADVHAVAKRITQVLGSSVIAECRETRPDAFQQNLRMAKLTARIISATSLFVGVFIIFNTVAMTVVERKRETGMLRAIGTSRKQIWTMVICEAAVMGIIGTALGLLLGICVAKVAMVHAGRGLPELVVRHSVLFGGAALGLAATLVAAAVPAVMAARVPPVEATQPFRRSAARSAPLRRLVVGLALIVGLVAVLHLPFRTSVKVPLLTTAGIFCLYLGAALVAPFLVAPLSEIISPVLGIVFRLASLLFRYSVVMAQAVFLATLKTSAKQAADTLRSLGKLAKGSMDGAAGGLVQGNLVRSAGRTALTACALMVGVSFVTDLSGNARSVVKEFRRTLDAFAGADLFVLPQTPSAASLDPDTFRSVEGVQAVTPMKLFLADTSEKAVRNSFFASGKIMFVGVEPETFEQIMMLDFERGEFHSALEALKQGKAVLISSDLVRLGGPRMGGYLKLKGIEGETAFKVVGEIRDPRLAVYTDWRDWVDIKGIIGSFVAIGSIADARECFGGTGFSFALVKLGAGVDREAVGKKVRTVAWGTGCKAQWIGQRNEKMFEDARDAINTIHAVLFAAIFLAALAVLNTMTMNVIERTREIGVLRALGATRGQILEMFLMEAGAIGVIGAVLGIAVGLMLMHASLTLNRMVMGWRTDLVIPFREMALAGAVSILVAILGGVYPAIRAARLRIVQAIQME